MRTNAPASLPTCRVIASSMASKNAFGGLSPDPTSCKRPSLLSWTYCVTHDHRDHAGFLIDARRSPGRPSASRCPRRNRRCRHPNRISGHRGRMRVVQDLRRQPDGRESSRSFSAQACCRRRQTYSINMYPLNNYRRRLSPMSGWSASAAVSSFRSCASMARALTSCPLLRWRRASCALVRSQRFGVWPTRRIRQAAGIFAPVVLGLAALLVMQVVAAAHTLLVVRRWKQHRDRRPRSRLRLAWHFILLPALAMCLAIFLVVLLPRTFETNFAGARIHAPDGALLIGISATFACVWTVARTVLLWRSLGAGRRP